MPSSYSTSLRFNLQATGEGINVWGSVLNSGALALVDTAVAGWTTKALTTDYTLTSANGTSDEARSAMLKFTGTGSYAVTVPAVSKRYDVWNALTGVLTITNGSASVTLQAGEVSSVLTDGGASMVRVQPQNYPSPTRSSDVATKQYADNLAFTANAGILPGQTGNAGKVLTSDGASTASWTGTLNGFSLTGGATVAGGLAVTGGLTFTGSTKQNVNPVAALDIDVSASEFHTKSISTSSTFTFSHATASEAQGFALELTISSAAVPAWPASVKWANSTSPTLGNGTHVLGFLTFDGGTTWTGALLAYNQG